VCVCVCVCVCVFLTPSTRRNTIPDKTLTQKLDPEAQALWSTLLEGITVRDRKVSLLPPAAGHRLLKLLTRNSSDRKQNNYKKSLQKHSLQPSAAGCSGADVRD